MAVETRSFFQLIKAANSGEFSLPAFQRDWKWQRKQVQGLYDSLRNGYPVGALLAIEASSTIDLQPKSFSFTGTPDPTAAKKLILDGQQRLTAGIQLLIGSSPEQNTHYFFDLRKIETLFVEHCSTEGLDPKTAIIDERVIEHFSSTLDQDTGYLVFKRASKDPASRLIKEHLLFSPLLSMDNERALQVHLDAYVTQYPEQRELVRWLLPIFKVNEGPQVPIITIESGLSIEAVSRVFSTLNTTGKMLTPFELVVATLFPKGVNLKEDLELGSLGKQHYLNMDLSHEIVLQTAVLLEGKDPKKSLLPKNLTAEIWEKNKDKSFELLEEVGEFLSLEMGFALNLTSNYVPYDSLFCPLAVIWDNVKPVQLTAKEKSAALTKIKKWIVGSVAQQRYQEGVHNKQKQDAIQISNWITSGAPTDEPAWLQDARLPSLRTAEPRGAIGKLRMCLINRQHPKDPIDNTDVSLGRSNVEDHHIFPNKFVPYLKGWDPKIHKHNLALNIMRATSGTNKAFLQNDPQVQVQKSENTLGVEVSKDVYEDQFLSENLIAILKKSSKSEGDFHDFVALRQNLVFAYIKKEFGISEDLSTELEEAEASY